MKPSPNTPRLTIQKAINFSRKAILDMIENKSSPSLPWVLVSISNTVEEADEIIGKLFPPKGPVLDNLVDASFFIFGDYETPPREILPPNQSDFNYPVLKEMIIQLTQWATQVPLFVVHCTAGISRSGAVVQWLKDMYPKISTPYLNNAFPNQRMLKMMHNLYNPPNICVKFLEESVIDLSCMIGKINEDF